MPSSRPRTAGSSRTAVNSDSTTDVISPSAPSSVAQPSRRDLVSSAIGSIQRFKQSWVSIMILKASVGLSQVIVLVVLLALASALPSPLYPSQSQSARSDACPRPELFQSWMGVQIARLSICWAVSCYTCIRAQRAHRRELSLQRAAPTDPEQHSGTVGNDGMRGMGIRSESIPSSLASSRHPPSLVHSDSSSSTASLAHICNGTNSVPATPPAIYGSSVGSSTMSFGSASGKLQPKNEPVVEVFRDAIIDAELGVAVLRRIETERQAALGRAQVVSASPARGDLAQLRAARDMAEGREAEVAEANEISTANSAIDTWAARSSKLLGLISAVLFILGNILLFSPLPSADASCYNAAPLLWWGVMTVTGVGWFLVAQVVIVTLGVGIGGPMILALFRTLRIVPTPPEPEPPRAPPPSPLTADELARLKTVVYVPDPTEPLPTIRTSQDSPSCSPNHSRNSSLTSSPDSDSRQSDSDKITLVPTQMQSRRYDSTRLPHPPHELKSHQATCAICQENFQAPQEGRTIMMRADALRLLGCGHVYHVDCIDQWLMKGSGNCPFCNRPVRETLASQKQQDDSIKTEKSITPPSTPGIILGSPTTPQEDRSRSWFRR